MEPGISIPHSQGFSNNPYPELNQPNSSYRYISLGSILILSSHLCLGLPKGFFPAGIPVKFLKTLLPSSIFATWPAHLSLVNLITLTVLGKWYTYVHKYQSITITFHFCHTFNTNEIRINSTWVEHCNFPTLFPFFQAITLTQTYLLPFPVSNFQVFLLVVFFLHSTSRCWN